MRIREKYIYTTAEQMYPRTVNCLSKTSSLDRPTKHLYSSTNSLAGFLILLLLPSFLKTQRAVFPCIMKSKGQEPLHSTHEHKQKQFSLAYSLTERLHRSPMTNNKHDPNNRRPVTIPHRAQRQGGGKFL